MLLPKGDPGAPLSDDELDAKFRANCAGLLTAEAIDRLRAAILGLRDADVVAGFARLTR